jgi:hypothetical protein
MRTAREPKPGIPAKELCVNQRIGTKTGLVARTVAWAVVLPVALCLRCMAQDSPDPRSSGHYSLDSWMAAVGLPDDCFKSIVDADGAYLTELGRASLRQGVYPLAPVQSPVKIPCGLSGGTEGKGSG